MSTIQRVLDLDLDFFLDVRFLPRRSRTDRLPISEGRPWENQRVREFLEGQWLLATGSPIPGKLVTDHHEAYWYLRDLVRSQRLRPPFEIHHVDSHADLGIAGIGNDVFEFLLTEHLAKRVEEREDPPLGRHGMNEANYLLFLIACRWVSSITYVHNPATLGDDVPYTVYRNRDTTRPIELQQCTKSAYRDHIMGSPLRVEAYEPAVPLVVVSGEVYQSDKPFDCMVLAHSPPYTPAEADALLPVIRQYMDEVR
jgi:hypothetical protein